MTIRGFNRFFLLATAPFFGILIILYFLQMHLYIPKLADIPNLSLSLDQPTQQITNNLDKAKGNMTILQSLISNFYSLYEKTTNETAQLVQVASAQAARPEQIFNARVANVLGNPAQSINSGNIELNLYYVSGSQYKGYALKAYIKSDKAMQMVLGQDRVGGSETTLSEVNRYGAIAGINAGGFADDPKSGKRYPLSTTVYNGNYVYGFEPTFDDLTFVGISKNEKLIGGKFSSQDQLDSLHPEFGATFVPQLLQHGTPLSIPSKWLYSPRRAPRTVIGNFSNDQLLIFIADGYSESGGSGATLPEMQDLLERLHIQDAYNLDGGGSTSLVFGGRVINHPSDGQLRRLPTHFLFFK